MSDTKKNILLVALKLFSKNGYDSVSVSQIAEQLGITKGALYRHYKNKRDIFDSIFDYVCELDIERSKKAGIPEKEFSEMPSEFKKTSLENLKEYMISQFYYWTEDDIACDFRKMLTLEQYKSEEMENLYQKVLVSGPIEYIEDIFREILFKNEIYDISPKQMAIEFYSPFYLMLSLSDSTSNPDDKKEVAELYIAYVNNFIEKYNLVLKKNMMKNKEVKK